MNDLFEGAEVISAYSRAQALEDGVLVDVSEMAKEAGFTMHTVFTQAVYAKCQPPRGNRIQSFEGRAWDVIYMASMAVRRARGTVSRVPFVVRIGNRNEHMLIDCGPGDQGEPVLTIGYSQDF